MGSELEQKIIPGGAGLVGQNLVAILRRQGYRRLVVIDKHAANLEVLGRMHPDVVTEHADLAEPGAWERHFAGADAVVMLQAQIGGTDPLPFVRNNITATDLILDAIERHAVPTRCTSAPRWSVRWPMTTTPAPSVSRSNGSPRAAFHRSSCARP